MKKGITLAAIFVIVASMAGVGSAMPEDLIGFDTPAERKVVWQDKITAYWDMLERQGVTGWYLERALFDYYDYVMYELEEYTYMYELIGSMELTDSPNLHLNCSA